MKKNLTVVIGAILIMGSVFFIYKLGESNLEKRRKSILLDDFEDLNDDNIAQFVDFGSGNNSEVAVMVSQEVKNSGKQSLRVKYKSVPSGYMWVARGYDLDVKGASKWLKRPERIDWKKVKSISFFIYGDGKGTQIAFDIRDKNKEYWRCMFTDDTVGWRRVECPLDKFFARSDWQPDDAIVNGVLDFPIKSFQFEPRTPGEGAFYVDTVELNL